MKEFSLQQTEYKNRTTNNLKTSAFRRWKCNKNLTLHGKTVSTTSMMQQATAKWSTEVIISI
ncbi:hypothetical protein IGI04_011777 [Brassica rapa subsp. trilocularis]|uniref:Uncharacterized protein n=1 Tax=Brassica rapa subsp. trilocularis TaxID=1813537 RepID=A0ABQ7N4V3_BRACM|nr:hypothetical protein IGI04_011777 [Brassica rapa subsp. trilocularis]